MRKLRLTPFSRDGKLYWSIEEYYGWVTGWVSLGSTSSLEGAKEILKAMKEVS